MDSSNSSSDLLALALGTHTVNIEKLSVEQRLGLVQSVIRRCEPLKYFPGFQSLRDLTDWKRGNRVYETSGVLWTEIPFGRLFFLSTLHREKRRGEEGVPLVYKEHLLLEDHGKFVRWEETTTEECDRDPPLFRETARASSFHLSSEERVMEALTHPEVVRNIVERLAGAAEHDSSKRFERFQRLEYATWYLRGLKDRLVIGESSDPDDIPF